MGVVLAQPSVGEIDHLIDFTRRKLFKGEKNYTTIEREDLTMVYALQKLRHCFLGSHFNMFTDRSTLKYMMNKPIPGANIFRWLLLF